MALTDIPHQANAVQLLQRSLSRGRLGHAYLFTGEAQEELEQLAGGFARTLNCQQRPEHADPHEMADCGECLSCRKIGTLNHPDVRWVRPESKTRIISVEQIRELMQSVYLKPTESPYKISILVAADRLNVQAANAFLKTLEEPPGGSIFILLSTQPQRMLETILSRCLRIHAGGPQMVRLPEERLAWLQSFAEQAVQTGAGLLNRYRLLDSLLRQLQDRKKETETTMSEQSPLEQYEDVDPKLMERWKDELAASIEAQYRHQRSETIAALQVWMRDVWLGTRGLLTPELAGLPELDHETRQLASRINAQDAADNIRQLESLQRLLYTNVQESLALEVGLLKLKL